MMATVISPTNQRVIIEGVSWETYERLLADFGDSHAVRVAFDRGTLEIMAPSFAHERPSHLLALIVDLIALEWSIDLEAAGSTTLKREDVERGFEPDAAFYIRHAADVRGHTTIDLQNDPPPDLAIEVDITHPSLNKFPIYAALGIPEIWRYDGQEVRFYRLQERAYVVMDASQGLPGVTSRQVTQLLDTSRDLPRAIWMRSVQEWARTLAVGNTGCDPLP
jgi:Uma2 family endonuclease